MDGIPREDHELSQTYLTFAKNEAAGQSTVYFALSSGIAYDPVLLGLIGELPLLKRQPNLVLAAARWHGAPLESYVDFSRFVIDHWAEVSRTILDRSTQTNEPARCATLLPVLAQLPQPLALIEVGASAGLCLYPDRYAYSYSGTRLGDASVVFPCVTDGAVPDALPQITWRAGLDLNPLDVRDSQAMAWLENLVWPGQDERVARLRQAIDIVRADPPRILKGDLLTDLDGLIAQAPRDATVVVFHTAVLAYVSPADREVFREKMSALKGHWISNEAPSVLGNSPAPGKFVLSLDGTPVAHTGPHGQAIHWL